MKLAVFLICSGIGYLLGHYLPDPWAAYVSILVSYHLFLFWLVITADHDAGFSMPVLPTIVTHAAFLAVLVGLAIGRRYVPLLGLVRIFVPALAPFECDWLFRPVAPRRAVSPENEPAEAKSSTAVAGTSETPAKSVAPAAAKVEYSADEHTAWMSYLKEPRRAFRKPGLSVGDEFKLWQADRAQGNAMPAQKQHSN
jgi:hypothetical protein